MTANIATSSNHHAGVQAERAMISIGNLQVDFIRREIRHNKQLLQVGSRAFDILELLANANGALVSKDEIMRVVWPTTVVEENNLDRKSTRLNSSHLGIS